MSEQSESLRAAIAEIDAANAADPTQISFRGRQRPKELAHAECATEWLEKLVPAPSDTLRLAVRAHHLRRWTLPRSEYPLGRPGYLRWRKELQKRHAAEVAAILGSHGYSTEEVERVGEIIRKKGLGNDDEVQAFEDALCLVFIETQLADFAPLHSDEKMRNILKKTWRKMSEPARQLAMSLEPTPAVKALLDSALTED